MVEERSFSLAGLLETRWNLAAQLTHPDVRVGLRIGFWLF
jgi:hypothetical protein